MNRVYYIMLARLAQAQSFLSVFSISIAFAADAVFYGCRELKVQYSSKFEFNCSNRSEVIYVKSAVLGFSPSYKADNGQYECPSSSGTCVNSTAAPFESCTGRSECYIAQRILLYNESGLLCTINGTSGNRGANFIQVNYSCISTGL